MVAVFRILHDANIRNALMNHNRRQLELHAAHFMLRDNVQYILTDVQNLQKTHGVYIRLRFPVFLRCSP